MAGIVDGLFVKASKAPWKVVANPASPSRKEPQCMVEETSSQHADVS